MVSETARQDTQATETFQDARRAHQSMVFAFVSRRIKPREDAEDVTAEVFLVAYRHWAKKRGETRLWLFGIARRKIADAYRRRRGVWR
jgi:DNA-directed RNA polymerase specialized sigma24 family protein